MGVTGTLDPANYFDRSLPSSGGQYDELLNGTLNWNAGNLVDDLWHAAINGRGEYFSSESPNTLMDSFTKFLNQVTSRTGSAASLSANGSTTSGGTAIYQVLFNTSNWAGRLIARQLDANGNPVANLWEAGTSGLNTQNYLQTFLLTGIIMDALHSRHPAWYWGPGHFKSGFTQGAVYSGVFMGLIHAVAGALSVPGVWSLLTQYPLASAGIAGIILFPFIKTIIESFEGSLRFVLRLRNNYGRWDHCLRGGAVGAAIALGLREGLPAAAHLSRFLFRVAAGAAAYAAVNLLRDFLNAKIFGERLSMQAPRIYLAEVGIQTEHQGIKSIEDIKPVGVNLNLICRIKQVFSPGVIKTVEGDDFL